MAEKFYITTPIYFPSAKLHIGHAYSTTVTDALARFKRKEGYDVFFLTGSDEHGQKMERVAIEKGMAPKAYVDEIIKSIKELWSLMDISYDDFIRTTDPRHEKAVQDIFMRLYEKGDIYKDVYEGAYCSPCESFWTDHQLVDGKCPDCGRDVEQVKEESYYFRLSKYQDRLIDYMNSHPEFIQPESRKNEMMQNFLLPGLEDVSVSRTSFKWGIPVPFDPDHVIYVWIDALTNYITALGYGSDDERLFEKYWPANVHVMAKEIVRFHSIIWPAILMALEEELPETIYAHGWLLLEGGKMSKSKGNVVDPVILCDRYGVDAIRYFLLSHMSFDQDATFSNEALLTHINTDLANDLGNLLSRTVAMIEKYFDGLVPPADTKLQAEDIQLQQQCIDMVNNVKADMDALHVANALSQIWKYISFCNKYIDKTEPWVLGKTDEGKPRLGTVLYTLAESLRIIAVLLEAFMPNTSPRIYEQLGIANDNALHQWSSIQGFGELPAGTKVCKGEALFPRIDIEAELESLEALSNQGAELKQEESASEEMQEVVEKDEISIEDFAKLDLRTGKILACVPVEKADRLLQFRIKMGDEERTILSGIRKWYDNPEALVGKTVVVIANLKPRKIRGIMSHGMLLSAIDESNDILSLLTSLNEIADGSEIS